MATLTRVEPEPSARAALPSADYADAFRTTSPAFFPAETWARAAFEDVPPESVVAQLAVWRAALLLRLGSRADADLVAGWTVVDRAPARLVLGAESWHLEARLVFESTPATARVTTLLRYRNPAGRAAWAAVGPLHRRSVPGILAGARLRLSRPEAFPMAAAGPTMVR
jgi:hypothetical protein